MNAAIHTLYQAFDNRHAQTGAGNARHTKTAVAFKRLINLLQEFGRHTAAGILDDKGIMHTVALIARLTTRQKADFAMCFGIFNSIRQNIIQNLLQAL